MTSINGFISGGGISLLIWIAGGLFYINIFHYRLCPTMFSNRVDGSDSSHAAMMSMPLAQYEKRKAFKIYLLGLGGAHALLLYPHAWAFFGILSHGTTQLAAAVLVIALSSFFLKFRGNPYQAKVFLRGTRSEEERRSLLSQPESKFIKFTMFYLSILSSVIVVLYVSPLDGWDTLTYWARRALFFISDAPIPRDTNYQAALSRHPDTNAIMLAWSAGTQVTGALSFAKLPWLLGSVSLWLIAYGFIACLTGERLPATVSAVTVVTLPLLENHVAIAGYSEIWLSVGFLGALTFGALIINAFTPMKIMLFLLFCAVCLLTKNTSVAYLAPLLFGYALVASINRYSDREFRMEADTIRTALVSLAVILISLEAFLVFFEHTVANISAALTTWQINVMGYSFSISIAKPSEVFSILFHAYFINQSFSVVGICIIVMIYIFMFRSITSIHQQFCLILLFIFFLSALGGLIFFEQVRYFAQFSNDTGFSRAVIPINITAMMVFGLLAAQQSVISPSLRRTGA